MVWAALDSTQLVTTVQGLHRTLYKNLYCSLLDIKLFLFVFRRKLFFNIWFDSSDCAESLFDLFRSKVNSWRLRVKWKSWDCSVWTVFTVFIFFFAFYLFVKNTTMWYCKPNFIHVRLAFVCFTITK